MQYPVSNNRKQQTDKCIDEGTYLYQLDAHGSLRSSTVIEFLGEHRRIGTEYAKRFVQSYINFWNTMVSVHKKQEIKISIYEYDQVSVYAIYLLVDFDKVAIMWHK